MDGQDRGNGSSAERRGGNGRSPEPELSELRSRIDEVDRRLVSLIAKRCRLASVAGQKKRGEGRGLCDPDQEDLVLGRAVARARAAGLHEDRIRRLFTDLIGLSLWVQAAEGPAEGPGRGRTAG